MILSWILSLVLGIPARNNYAFYIIANIFNFLALLTIIISWFRMFSKNIPKRYNENQKFLKIKSNFLSIFGFGTGADRYNRVFKCPKCKQKIRIPKGKGKIAIRCPKCGVEFIRRS